MTEPRSAKPTVKFVDDYCQWYQPIFPEVRSFEAFKNLHIGMLADIKRKSLPAIARVAGLDQEQSLRLFSASVVPLSFGKLQPTLKPYPKTQLGM
jgi:SRSO17 transposase